MNVAQFANELTELIVRWTTPRREDAGQSPEPRVPLTKQQIFDTMENVLQIVWGENYQLINSSSVTTPTCGIATCTPNAPVVPKPSPTQPNAAFGRFRSLESLMQNSNNLKSADAKSEGDPESTSENILPEDKKFISISSPSITVSIPRSDTFIREENAGNEKDSNKESSDDKDDVFEKAEKKFAAGMSHEFLEKLEALRIAAKEVVSKIENVVKEQTSKPIHRLSGIGSYQWGNRGSTLNRPAPPPKMRRSSSGFQGTPTSSKLNTTMTTQKEQSSGRRKTMSTATIQLTTASVNTTSSRPATGTPSPSPVKKSGLKSAKSSKYAHVQSTIPKSTSATKKKAQ